MSESDYQEPLGAERSRCAASVASMRIPECMLIPWALSLSRATPQYIRLNDLAAAVVRIGVHHVGRGVRF